jgi:hypothetical protein
VVILAACYLAGVITVTEVSNVPVRNGPEMARLAPNPAPSPDPSPSTVPPVSAIELEWQALDSPGPRPDLFRRAGDQYLKETGDFQSALRCYRSALDGGSETELTISPEDSWLLIELKTAKQKERLYARNGS